jgi:hypothetical protein
MKEKIILTMVILVALNFLMLSCGLVFVDVPVDNRDTLNIMVGTLGGGWMTIIGAQFGAKKNETISSDRKADSSA